MSYYRYLVRKGFAIKTIKRLLAWQSSFENWCKDQGKKPAKQTESDLVHYLYTQKGQLKRSSLQMELSRIKHYYGYLGIENPLDSFKISGKPEKKEYQLLKDGELNTIYQCYQSNQRLNLESKVLLGLLVYQGIAAKELPYIKTSQIDLKRAKLFMQGGNLQSREIALEAVQMSLFIEHVADKLPTDKLLTYKNDKQLQNKHQHLVYQVKRELNKNNKVLHFNRLQDLRTSRIAIWVKQKGLLEAQYLAGHQYLLSTQKYQQADDEALRKALEQMHPMF